MIMMIIFSKIPCVSYKLPSRVKISVIYKDISFQVITITLSITFSATVALMLLFWPKAYIIVWKPEQNHRGAFTTTTEVRCHVGQRSFAEKSISRRQYS